MLDIPVSDHMSLCALPRYNVVILGEGSVPGRAAETQDSSPIREAAWSQDVW